MKDQGYFVMDDGQRSCDVVAKTKKTPKESTTTSSAAKIKTKERSMQTLKVKSAKATSVDAATFGSAQKEEKKA